MERRPEPAIEAAPAPPPGPIQAAGPDRAPGVLVARWLRPSWVLPVLAALMLAGALWWSERRAAPVRPAEPSIAVMPFINLGPTATRTTSQRAWRWSCMTRWPGWRA